jgi:hypothetical protein
MSDSKRGPRKNKAVNAEAATAAAATAAAAQPASYDPAALLCKFVVVVQNAENVDSMFSKHLC